MPRQSKVELYAAIRRDSRAGISGSAATSAALAISGAPIEPPLGECGHCGRCQVSRASPRRSPCRAKTSAIPDLVQTPTARPGPAP